MMKYTKNGDDMLSSFTRRLWTLAYSCLLKFECPVIFNVSGPDVPRRFSQYIRFFVPAQHPQCYEVIAYLKKELKDDERPEKDNNDEFWFGTYIDVLEYSGLEPYLEQEECHKLAENMAKSFMQQIKTLKNAS